MAYLERMKSEKCQGRSANYFGKGVGYQYAYVLALMRQNDEKYGLPPMDTIKNFLTYLKDFIGLTDLPSEDTIGRGINRLSGKYPNWRIENGNQIDVLEAQHVAQRFLSMLQLIVVSLSSQSFLYPASSHHCGTCLHGIVITIVLVVVDVHGLPPFDSLSFRYGFTNSSLIGVT